jgi:subtilisin family serine protease
MVIFKDNSAVRNQLSTQTFANKIDKRATLRKSLAAFSASSQKNAIAILKANTKTASAFTSFWITNRIFVNGADAATISNLAGLPEVLEIREQVVAHISPAVKSESTILAEWGIENTKAPQVHTTGNRGENIIVSSIDTGVRHTHEALTANYRNDGYSWFDPYSGAANPIDDNGHGTHTMGIISLLHQSLFMKVFRIRNPKGIYLEFLCLSRNYCRKP